MNNRTYTLLTHEREPVMVEREGIYSYRPAGGKWPWLQRILFRLLDWMGCTHQETTVNIRRVDVQFDSVAEYLFDSLLHIRRDGYKPAAVIMGAPDFERLANEYDIAHMLDFTFPGDYQANVHPKHLRAMYQGLPVYVLPWLEGCVVLPGRALERWEARL